MKIGNIDIKGKLALGPMAGVTDLPFRILCKEQGVDLLYTEMVSAKGILYQNKNTEALVTVDEREHPIALQLFGSDPQIMGDMAKQIEERNFDILDINMGCPVPKIVNNGEGSALLKNPLLIERIVSSIVKSIKKPVTVKIRKGFYKDECCAVEAAKAAEQGGAVAIAVHGRTREQYYGGRADWEIIKQVKESVKIPVIGNGDIVTPQDAEQMLRYTSCDGIMIARAARGNPWIFKQVKEYLDNGTLIEKPNIDEVIEMILRHAKLQIEWKGEYVGIREMRKHVAWYTAGYPGSSRLRNLVNEVVNLDDLVYLLTRYKEGRL